jgi:hypothetical protein
MGKTTGELGSIDGGNRRVPFHQTVNASSSSLGPPVSHLMAAGGLLSESEGARA